jgi:hypothetical protein
MLPPIHLRIFVRDLATMIKYSGDGDICQALFEDYILHTDEKSPPMKRGHYSRNEPQIRLCMEYIEFCNQLQPGAITFTDPLFPIGPDSSRFVYNIPAKINGVDNVSPNPKSLEAFWKTKQAE